MSGLSSRIPKLSFGKRTPQTSGIPSRESTPVQYHDDRAVSKSPAPATRDSSAIVLRSKSLRLPRKQYGVARGGRGGGGGGGGLESSSTSKIESRMRKNQHGGLKKKDSSSSPDSSRASSPGYTAVTTNSNDLTTSTEVSGTDSDLVRSGENPFLRRRAQSFGAHVRRPHNNSRQLRPPPGTNWSRENTPTPRSVTPSSLTAPSPSRRARRGDSIGLTPSGHRQVRSRSSLGTATTSNGSATESIAEEGSSKSAEKSRNNNNNKIRRADSNDTIDGGSKVVVVVGGSGVRKMSTTRGRRPNSYVMNEVAADLNQLAQEISSTMGDDGSLHSPEIKSVVARIHPITATSRHRELTSSGKVGVATPAGHTPLGYTGGQRSSGKTSTEAFGMGSRNNIQTPETLGGRTRGMVLGGPREEKSHSRGVLNSRSSTPSSGRSTPVGGVSTGRSKTSPPSETTTVTPAAPQPGGPVRSLGSRLHSTQRKIVRVREARPVGINELEGAVLMDSDEYLKISHDVKALKTVILKLKRELQNGGGGEVGMGQVTESGGPTPSDSAVTRRQGGVAQRTDFTKQINSLTAEKARALEESERCRRELETMSEKLGKVTSDLKREEEEKVSLNQRLQEMEKHRDMLLDKVERLHADKHKLEDRLSSLEKVQFYEKSWLEEGGGEGEGGWEENTMLGGFKGEKTESDVGENSEPESSAVCSGPHT